MIRSAVASIGWELLVILLLLIGNAFLALSEIAVVSARRSRLLQRAERGDAAAAAAAALAQSPGRFLSTVQVGITLMGILSGAYGGATIAEELAAVLAHYPSVGPYSDAVAFGIVVIAIAYLSVIVGELVPKRVALSNPERFATMVARPMVRLSRLAAPVVAVLEYSSNIVMRLFRLPQGGDMAVTEADVAGLVAAGTAAGVFEPAERRMVERVFRLDDEPVAAIMTPRRDIVWLNTNDTAKTHFDIIRQHSYSRFPVCDGSLDRVLGIIHVRDLCLAREAAPDAPADLLALAQRPLFVPEWSPALDALEQFQNTRVHVALVIDEHGGVDGLLTVNNLLEFVIALPMEEQGPREPAVVKRRDGSWLVDGALSVGDFYSALGVEQPEGNAGRSYHTVAGLMMTQIGRIPSAGDRVELGSLVLEVVDMDGLRIDKVLVTRRPDASSP